MDAEMLAVIEKQLPSQVGNVLKQRLEVADRCEKKAQELGVQVLTFGKALDDTQVKLLEAQKRLEGIDVREAKVLEREIKMSLLECKLQCADEKVVMAKEIVALVFANNKYKYQESGSVPVATPSGAYIQNGGFNKAVQTEG
jgi:hypothetical protein